MLGVIVEGGIVLGVGGVFGGFFCIVVYVLEDLLVRYVGGLCSYDGVFGDVDFE